MVVYQCGVTNGQNEFIDGVDVPLERFLSLDKYCCNILCAHGFMSRSSLFFTELTVVSASAVCEHHAID